MSGGTKNKRLNTAPVQIVPGQIGYILMKKIILIVGLIALTACAPARIAGNAAVTGGQVVLGAADLVL